MYQTGLLRNPLGVALTHVLARAGGHLALPEVVQLEVERNASDHARQLSDVAHQKLGVLAHLLGHQTGVVTGGPYEGLADRRFTELKDLLVRIPLTFDHAREALVRVVNHVPPSKAEDQQFKDTLIWLALVDLAKSRPVAFVTKDKGFFADRDPARGLAPQLLADLKGSPHEVRVYSDLGDCLKALRADLPKFDVSMFRESATAELSPTIESFTRDRQLTVGVLEALEGSVFGTEKPEIVALDLTARFDCTLRRSEAAEVEVGRLAIQFTGAGNVRTRAIEGLQLEKLEVFAGNGERLFGNVFLRASDDIHLRTLFRPLVARFPVDA